MKILAKLFRRAWLPHRGAPTKVAATALTTATTLCAKALDTSGLGPRCIRPRSPKAQPFAIRGATYVQLIMGTKLWLCQIAGELYRGRLTHGSP
jgi:hypothetical protein